MFAIYAESWRKCYEERRPFREPGSCFLTGGRRGNLLPLCQERKWRIEQIWRRKSREPKWTSLLLKAVEGISDSDKEKDWGLRSTERKFRTYLESLEWFRLR